MDMGMIKLNEEYCTESCRQKNETNFWIFNGNSLCGHCGKLLAPASGKITKLDIVNN